MPAPQFIGPLLSETFGGKRGGAKMTAAEVQRILREGSPDIRTVDSDGMASDQGAATERANRLERRVREIDAMEARANAKKEQGTRTRGLSKKLRDERERAAGRAADIRSSIQKAETKQARVARAAAKRKEKAAAKKAGQNVVAGGTKRAANVAKTGKKAAAAPKKAAKKTAAAPKKAAKKAGNPVAKKPRAPRTPAQREARNARERAARARKKAGG